MTNDDLLYLTAVEALALFRARKLSPVELAKAQIARAEAVDDRLKAFTYRHFEEALDQAKAAERRFMSKGGRIRPLEGLTLAIKDESFIAGKPTSMGSLLYKDYIADTTSTNNTRILKAGGIVLARSATPEFSCAPYTHSRLWGVSRNPWNPKFTPGGSSGGSGAALAAGMASLATGSDIGGSIRIPAACCGLVGFKPPYGRNPDDPPFNLDPYCHTGPMARSVGDAILLQNIMSGPSATDIATLRPKLRLPSLYPPIRDWRIAYSFDLGFYEVDREVAANMRRALDVFRSLGAKIEEVKLSWTENVMRAGLAHLEHIFGAYLAQSLKKHGRDMTAYARAFAKSGAKSRSADLLNAMEVANQMQAELGPILERHHVFICPTNALPAIKADFDQERDKIRINGRVSPLPSVLAWCMTLPFNMLSRLPVLSLPSGRSAKTGIPTGIQIVGRSYRDPDVFRAGFAYEKAVGFWYRNAADRPSLP